MSGNGINNFVIKVVMHRIIASVCYDNDLVMAWSGNDLFDSFAAKHKTVCTKEILENPLFVLRIEFNHFKTSEHSRKLK